jgi:hypothetical protein
VAPKIFGLSYLQGDQIGRIFAQWAIVYFGQWFEIYIISANFWATFLCDTSYVLILTKNGLGYILGDFFKNSSGHPDYLAYIIWPILFGLYYLAENIWPVPIVWPKIFWPISYDQ